MPIDRCCISVSEECNMSCKYCYFFKDGKRGKNMSADDLVGIVDRIGEYAVDNGLESFKIGLVGGGEPMLRGSVIASMVTRAELYPPIKMYVISNGTAIDDEMIDFFYEHRSKVDICFSIDGPKEIHDAFRKDRNDNGTFAIAMDSALRYCRIFGKMPSVNCTIHKYHILNRTKVLDFFIENEFKNITFSRIEDAGVELRVSAEEFRDFLAAAHKAGLNIRQLTSRSRDCCMYGNKCGVGFTNIFYSSGNVYPCGRFFGRDDYIIGRYLDDLSKIEYNMSRFVSNEDDSCYYNRNVNPITEARP